MSEPSDIVERLGGADFLSAKFNISVKAIEMWDRRGRGIPGKWHIPMLFLAAERGVPLSMEELSAAAAREVRPEPAEARP